MNAIRHENVECMRCENSITTRSMFVILLTNDNGKLKYDVILARKIPSDDAVVLHLQGDRQCQGEASGFVLRMLNNLGLDTDTDVNAVLML